MTTKEAIYEKALLSIVIYSHHLSCPITKPGNECICRCKTEQDIAREALLDAEESS